MPARLSNQLARDELILHAAERGSYASTRYARAEAAAQSFREKKYADAADAWREIALGDPTAVRSVARAVIALRGRGPEGLQLIKSFCRMLLSHGRAAQAITCMGNAPDWIIPDLMWLEAHAIQPLLTAEDVQSIYERRPTLREALSPIEHCTQPGKVSSVVLRPGFAPLSALATRVVDGLSRDQIEQSRCLLRVAAEACIAELTAAGTCSEPRSIGRYLEILDATTSGGLLGFIGGPLHVFFPGDFNEINAPHQIWNQGSEQASVTLFNMHVSLAYVLSRLRMVGSLYYDPAYHVAQAQVFWREGGHGQAFPEEALEGIELEANSDVAQSLDNLASFYAHQGALNRAEALYERALGIREAALGGAPRCRPLPG